MADQQREQLEYLLQQYMAGFATADELNELNDILLQSAYDEDIQDILTAIAAQTPGGQSYDSSEMQAMIHRILGNAEPSVPVVKMFDWKRIAVAASIILLLGVSTYFIFFNKLRSPGVVEKSEPLKDVPAPANNKAMITLADGSTVYLDSVGNGQFFTQNDITIFKTADGKIEYKDTAIKGQSTQLVYNTLTNPRGSKVVDITFSDGSRVWLNAGSSVTYPVAFIGNERKVAITGEAYFEIAHDKTKPFILSKNEMSVEVLGTHFNVNAYDDEKDIKVTLLEGSVRTSIANGESSVLKPGEQAQVSNSIKVVKDMDVEQVMAWKNGYFKFNRTDLKIIMREIARWYDVEVSYEGNVPVQLYNGDVPRNVNVSEVLKVLEYTGAHFRIEGKKVTVIK